MHNLDPILRPKSIAVIGASRHPNGIGWQILDNLLKHGFRGPVYPINPSADSIHSIRAYASIAEVPDPVDCAVVAVPAAHVLTVASECVAAGVRGIVIISAGFKEVGGAGVERERQLLEILEGSGIRLVGPNCMGVINTHGDVQMDATFAPAMPPPGPVAFISQSGAMGLSILDYAESLGIGLSMFVSAGNKADVDGNDLLEYWRHDPSTKLILMYLENFDDPARFVELGRALTTDKPVFVVKSGRTGAGARAAASHTGALAQTELATDALIAQAGAIRAQTVKQLFDFAMAFSNQPLPADNRVAVVTNAGGPGIIIADACEASGLDLPRLSPGTQEKLRTRLPEEASVGNPVDLIASATPESYEFAIRCVMEDDGIDAVIAAFVPPLGIHTQDIAEAIVHANGDHPGKPLLAVLMGRQGLPAGLAELHRANVPAYIFPESAARALGTMWRYSQRKTRPPGSRIHFETDDATVEQILDETVARGSVKLSEPDALRVLDAYGLQTCPWRFVSHDGTSSLATAAAEAAAEVEFPVAIKVVSPDIVHKTDVGGVALALETKEAVRRSVREMVKRIGAAAGAKPGRRARGKAGSDSTPRVDGVLVQQMAPPGRETIIGLTRVPQVGSMVMFGLGGIYVEVLRDVVLRLSPLRDADAREMIREVRLYKLLEGVRGEPARDLEALADALLRISQLAERHARIAEMDVNPLISYEQGAMAVDARIQLTGNGD